MMGNSFSMATSIQPGAATRNGSSFSCLASHPTLPQGAACGTTLCECGRVPLHPPQKNPDTCSPPPPWHRGAAVTPMARPSHGMGTPRQCCLGWDLQQPPFPPERGSPRHSRGAKQGVSPFGDTHTLRHSNTVPRPDTSPSCRGPSRRPLLRGSGHQGRRVRDAAVPVGGGNATGHPALARQRGPGTGRPCALRRRPGAECQRQLGGPGVRLRGRPPAMGRQRRVPPAAG